MCLLKHSMSVFSSEEVEIEGLLQLIALCKSCRTRTESQVYGGTLSLCGGAGASELLKFGYSGSPAPSKGSSTESSEGAGSSVVDSNIF
jgi:hypothetical protein